MRGLNENVPVQDVFCSGLGAIERLEGNCVRLYFYVSQVNFDNTATEKQVVAKLIVPISALPEAVLMMLNAASTEGMPTVPLVPEMIH
jgi:hypothetical protein